MDEVKLLPCPNPWCEDGIYLVETREGGFFRVGCSCGVAGPPSTDEALAIKFWNTRPPIDEVVERLRETLIDWRNCWLCPATDFEAQVERLLATTDAALAAMPAIDQDGGE